jgi:hypothetical protein
MNERFFCVLLFLFKVFKKIDNVVMEVVKGGKKMNINND